MTLTDKALCNNLLVTKLCYKKLRAQNKFRKLLKSNCLGFASHALYLLLLPSALVHSQRANMREA